MEENTNTLRKKAEELYKQNKFKDVIALLTDEELEREKDAELYAWKARANHRLDNDVAVTMLLAEKAIDADPNYFMGYFTRACAWDVKKENDKAIEDYTKAIELNPDFADAYNYRGIAWQNKKENDKAVADYDKAIVNYNKAIEIDPDYADAYNYRGILWYNKTDYYKAIADYTKAMELNPNFADAYYNRGLAWVAIKEKEYDKAIEDYTKAIELNPDYADAYYNERGLAWKAKGKYKEAINDYTDAIKIKPDFANAYYNMGLARKEYNDDPEKIKQDFEKYLELAIDENEIWTKYAKYYIEDLKRINDKELSVIADLVSNIKDILHLDEDCITHYTSLSVLKSLILDSSKFRISEGNFINDPSEGTEFFNFLYDNTSTSSKDGSSVESFSPKPFIGSFVAQDKYNDLNMWRFYGKEKGEEAKGCAITLRMQKFIGEIKNSLSNEKNKEARLEDENDINFYQVAYLTHGATNFYIPSSDEKSEELKKLMTELKDKVNLYNGDNKTFLEKNLNSIAFLFKSDAYKNENEVRLVVKGIEFEKKYNMDVSSPIVYIELVSIQDIVSQITLGPKVDKISEWEAAFHYRYGEKIPKIEISHLPYK
jgi:tetratricopeptide (TPR) repeat protein